MYYTCIGYSGLFDDFGTESGEFDPLGYIDFNHDSLAGYSVDVKLLNEGSAIKLACEILQTRGQGDMQSSHILNIRKLLKSERMNHMPELKAFIELALHSCSEGNKNLQMFIKNI
jgi:hypothetical protein